MLSVVSVIKLVKTQDTCQTYLCSVTRDPNLPRIRSSILFSEVSVKVICYAVESRHF